MNNAYDCTIEEVVQALFAGDAVESGYGTDYTFKDVISECRDLEDILLELAITPNLEAELFSYQIKNELWFAAERVAKEIIESYS